MTYTVKEKNKLFYLYNTNTKRMLTKSYDSAILAQDAVSRVNNRSKGIKRYHNCCRSHQCGRKNKKKTTKSTQVAASKKVPKRAGSKNVPKKANYKNVPKIKKKTKRRVALQPVNNSGSGKKILTRRSGQEKAFKYFASDEFEKRARQLDRDYKGTVF